MDKHIIRSAWRKRNDVLVIDQKLDIYFFVLWAIYAAWGWTSAVVNTTILGRPLFTIYPTFWGTAIGICGMIACGAIIASLFTASDRYRERVKQKYVEVVAVGLMGGLIAVHPVLQVLRFFTEDQPRPDTLILAFSYLVMPAFRVTLQNNRAQSIRLADKRYRDGEEEEKP